MPLNTLGPDATRTTADATLCSAAEFWAHSPNPPWQPQPQLLVNHLAGVARLAREFASVFGAGDEAELAGWLHDFGKFEPGFQRYIRGDSNAGERMPHAFHGAVVAHGRKATAAAFAIAGHHAGLLDRNDLQERLEETGPRAIALLPQIEHLPLPDPPTLPTVRNDGDRRSFEFFARFLFSALIDADRIDTAEHANPGSESSRRGADLDAARLLGRLAEHLRAKPNAGKLNAIRREVLAACETAAADAPGIFSLTVPTGGGKTLASTAFALRHALRHGLRRLIVVIPYLSVIEQTAKVLRAALGDGVVLEHHSQAGACETPDESLRAKLAAENWDAPVIVTTSVQFFESLYARRPSACRKLHRIARSIVVMDEVQTFPAEVLPPILDAIRELSAPEGRYGCSVLLCTATQPAFGRGKPGFEWGLDGVREVVPQPSRYFNELRRVRYHWPSPGHQVAVPELAARMARLRRGLAVLNTRNDCRVLFESLRSGAEDPATVFHLSTWMTPIHRESVLKAVKQRLDGDAPCLLISTQCIEAGVDIDFPVVFRAVGPFDSIIQAAGRCNREMKLGLASEGAGGDVFVLRLAGSGAARGAYRVGIEEVEAMLQDGVIDPENPDCIHRYFRRLYRKVVPGKCEIQAARAKLHFRSVAERFQLIKENTIPVVVPDADRAHQLVERGRDRGSLEKTEWRELQRYTVNLYEWQLGNLGIAPAWPNSSAPRLWPRGHYDDGVNGSGLRFGARPPDDFVV